MSIAKRVQVCRQVSIAITVTKRMFIYSNGPHLREHGTFTIAPGKILLSPLVWSKHI